MTENTQKPKDVTITKAKGRPMLTWVGKKPLARVRAYPAQAIERFDATSGQPAALHGADWSDWPQDLPQGGLLYHGDNKDVLAHLLANGFRGKVKLIYIDPPFDSGADYVRKVQLRGAKGTVKIDGEDYTLGEQVQYSDIWANDNYLQFMYERLLMLRELLADDGTLYLHCDWRKHHHLRCLVEEVFGSENFVSEVIWKRTSAHSNTAQGNKSFGSINDVILVATKSDQFTFNTQYVPYEEEYLKKYSQVEEDGRRYQLFDITGPGGAEKGNPFYEILGVSKHWRFSKSRAEELIAAGRIVQPKPGGVPRYKRYLDEMPGIPLQNIWEDIAPVNSQALDRSGYPTQKPDTLLDRLITVSSTAGDLILDCFVGSGTTVVAAQRLGRRWIGCDINKGAIQTTAKRIQELMRAQAATATAPQQGDLVEGGNTPQRPSQLGFATYRVNDYDLQIQHNEAVELACQHLGVARTRTDAFFDGTQGGRLVKIVPFNHPLTPLDLDAVRDELKTRPSEERDVMVVCLGWQLDARAWVDAYNRNRPVNKLHVVELRTDRKLGGIIKHEPLAVQASARREGDQLVVEVQDVVSPTIMQRLNLEQGVFRAQITDWRAVVDCILIDPVYNGQVFNVALADVPERKQDLVAGRYELPAPLAGSTVAVKVIDMLGEELVVTLLV
ncbi:site-specific DNA-methyltransferase [Acidovorax sp. Q11]